MPGDTPLPPADQEYHGDLSAWKVTFPELDRTLTENPSLRGFVFGYVAELRLREYLKRNPAISDVQKYANHDRRHKNDLAFLYKGAPVTIECKSLDTPKIKGMPGNWTGTFQCNASDSREVTFEDGSVVTTNCLKVGELPISSVC